jgi:hypothetical protein
MVMNAEKKSVANDCIEWLGILIGPVAWLIQFQINYALVHVECRHHTKLALHIVSVFFLLAVIGAGVVSKNYFRKTEAETSSSSSEAFSARRHFMAALGITTSALFALLIIAQAIASFILDPCQQ